MPLLTSAVMDSSLLIFAAVLLLKYSLLKDKDSKGLKWMSIGGIVLLIQVAMPATDLGTILGTAVFQTVGVILSVIAFVVVIIGSIKLILELV